jgi:hypothetical protein
MNEQKKSDDLDLVWGAHAIAAAIGTTRRKAFHLLEKGSIPARKVGGRWVAERGKLRAFFVEEAA